MYLCLLFIRGDGAATVWLKQQRPRGPAQRRLTRPYVRPARGDGVSPRDARAQEQQQEQRQEQEPL